MGSYIELNDTLQITKEQGFPVALDLATHKNNPYSLDDVKGVVFEFKNKPNIRIYHLPPVRVFLVENINGKWVYWGLVHILEVEHDYEKKTTSGKFKIIHINSYEDMKKAHELID
ncbi:hypothetical protein HGB13_01895, partial [bacterium]|nr:hypothetical protein [bacterium]